MWFVFEAEYEIDTGGVRIGNRPVHETMAWHGPFSSEAEVNEVARARMWTKIDIYAHKARVMDLTVRE